MATSIPDPIAIDAFVQYLRQRGVDLTVDKDVLRVCAPKGVVDPALSRQIASRKAGILSYLEGAHQEAASAIGRTSRAEPLPLGLVQQRMWLHHQLEPDTVLYNLPAAWRLRGPLELEAFLRAFNDVIARHEILRVSIRAPDGEPTQSFGPAGGNALDIEDLTCIPAADRERELMAQLLTLRDEIIDLEQGPPFRARLFRVAPDEHVLFLMPHHVVWDGWSFDIFLRDFGEIYAAAIDGRPASLPDLPIQYADYALWHRRWLEDGALQEQLAYWSNALAGELIPLDLPVDFSRPKRFSYRGDWEEFTIFPGTMEQITRIAAKHRSTSFIVLLSAWSAFIHRISGQDEMVVGVPIQARQSPEVSDLIGCFVNTLCLRLKIDPESSFEQLIEDIRDTSLDAYEYQDTPVDMLVDMFVTQHDPSRTPLFQTMFSHQQVSRRPSKLGAMSVSQLHVNPGAAPTDLMLAVMEGSAGARGVIHYSTDLFSPPTIRHLRSRFELFLEAALAHPATCIHALPILTPEDRSALTQWNGNAEPLPPAKTLHALLHAQAERTPERTAIRFSGETTTYGALEARSTQIANSLHSHGARPGGLIGVCLNRTPDLVATLIAVLKVGAAYVPLDPAYPTDRLRLMAQDAELALIVSEEDLAHKLEWPREYLLLLDSDAGEIDAAASDALECAADPHASESAAYVIYTSGSTGKPKGVVVPHRAVLNFLASMKREPGLSSDDRLLAITTTSFDIAVLELFGPLSVGAEVVLASREVAMDSHALAALLVESDATFMQGTPASWRMLLESGWSARPGFKALSGGEALAPDLAAELIARGAQLWNGYGPTETTVYSTCCRIESVDGVLPIGKPIDNTTVWILDGRGKPCPPGVRGEICIGGEGVTLGYLNRAELTAERFIPDCFSDHGLGVRANGAHPATLYRTGDLGRWRIDGMLEHLGRLDFQVKVRGYRIELGEIENTLLTCANIARATVLAREDRSGDVRLVAYVTAQPGTPVDERALLTHLRKMLPAYMIPQHIVALEVMPLLPNGKIDRKALPAPRVNPLSTADTQQQASASGADSDPRINYLVAVWSELLGTPAGPDDNFFDLGGHSMLAVQMVHRVARDTGVRIKLIRLGVETLAQLAADLPQTTAIQASAVGVGGRISSGLKRLLGLTAVEPKQ